jgi:hypothetical protein
MAVGPKGGFMTDEVFQASSLILANAKTIASVIPATMEVFTRLSHSINGD